MAVPARLSLPGCLTQQLEDPCSGSRQDRQLPAVPSWMDPIPPAGNSQPTEAAPVGRPGGFLSPGMPGNTLNHHQEVPGRAGPATGADSEHTWRFFPADSEQGHPEITKRDKADGL